MKNSVTVADTFLNAAWDKRRDQMLPYCCGGKRL